MLIVVVNDSGGRVIGIGTLVGVVVGAFVGTSHGGQFDRRHGMRIAHGVIRPRTKNHLRPLG